MSTNSIATGLTIAGTTLAVTYGFHWAQGQGLVGGDASLRAAIVMAGLALAWYGNQIPKAIVHSDGARAARRFSGWVFALAGLGAAIGGALLPIDLAVSAELVFAGGGLALVLLYCMTSRGRRQETA